MTRPVDTGRLCGAFWRPDGPEGAFEALTGRRRALLRALGSPESAFGVVHVAGTNGKGSVTAMLASALTAAGRRVGRFTSPHLHAPTERIALDHIPIPAERLTALEARVGREADRLEASSPHLPPLGLFDRWCAAAWLCFAEAGVELAVIEAGIGGRTDATDLLPDKRLTAITSIGRDHASRLGGTLEAIAREKAGIFRPGVPALSSATGSALAVLEAEARRIGAPFRAVLPLPASAHPAGGWMLALAAGPTHLPLAGHFQRENASLAVAALETLGVSARHIRAGLEQVRWPGRCETMADPAGGDWLLDGAHNAEALAALMRSWGDPAVVVVGIQHSKEARPMVEALVAPGRTLVLCPVPEAESWEPSTLAEWAGGTGRVAGDVEGALALARSLAPAGRRCVTGSLYLVGAARALLKEHLRGIESLDR